MKGSEYNNRSLNQWWSIGNNSFLELWISTNSVDDLSWRHKTSGEQTLCQITKSHNSTISLQCSYQEQLPFLLYESVDHEDKTKTNYKLRFKGMEFCWNKFTYRVPFSKKELRDLNPSLNWTKETTELYLKRRLFSECMHQAEHQF